MTPSKQRASEKNNEKPHSLSRAAQRSRTPSSLYQRRASHRLLFSAKCRRIYSPVVACHPAAQARRARKSTRLFACHGATCLFKELLHAKQQKDAAVFEPHSFFNRSATHTYVLHSRIYPLAPRTTQYRPTPLHQAAANTRRKFTSVMSPLSRRHAKHKNYY